jgi:outer membrane biosynthesis protein TonB
MALKDPEMHMFSVLGTAVLSAALFVPMLFLADKATVQKADFGEMEAIEASIAYKKAPVKQPQKPAVEPDVVKPDGVSHDENKKPDEKKPDEKKDPKKPDLADISKFKHSNDDNEPGKPTVEPGDFNGAEFGWASETKGHPFFQKLAADFREGWEIPSILDVKGAPVGCFHITPDGKIPDTKFKEKSGDQVLDDSVERRLEAVKKARNDNPVPVPTELLGATNRWICFRFDPNKGG